jgi:hypothetical protein
VRELSPASRVLLGHLLGASRGHPFIGDDVDTIAVARASEHVAEHVRPSRAHARDVADRIGALATGVEPATDPDELVAALRALLDGLAPMERFHLREVLSNALGGLSPLSEVPRDGWRRVAWIVAVDTLRNHRSAPVAERPPLLTDDVCRGLAHEGAIQSFSSVRMALRFTAPPGPRARELGTSPELCRHIAARTGVELAPGNGFSTENATYLLYEQEGDAVQPHVDPFGITNALVLLEHDPPGDGGAPSRLIVFGPGADVTPVDLRVGDMVVLPAGTVVHAREPIGAGEQVMLLSLVFAQPLRA